MVPTHFQKGEKIMWSVWKVEHPSASDTTDITRSPSYLDKMASDQPASLSPFAHFAYQPQLPEPSCSSVPFLIFQSFSFLLLVSHSRSKDPRRPLVSTVPFRKRKSTNPEGNSSSMHLVSRQKKKQLSDGCVSDPHSRSHAYIDPIWTQARSKKVKIYENLRGLDDHLQNGLDSTFFAQLCAHINPHNLIVIFCGIK